MTTDNNLFDKKIMQRVLDAEKSSAECMSKTIYKDLNKPISLIDIGCGPGHFANCFKRLGKDDIEVIALDCSEYACEYIDKDVEFVLHDLTKPLILNKKFDVALCLEVIEHIDEEYEDIVCENIINCAGKYVVLTVATPDQKDFGHVNLKPRNYWIEKFEKLGLEYDKELTHKWRTEWCECNLGFKKIEFYFVNNIAVFKVKKNESVAN